MRVVGILLAGLCIVLGLLNLVIFVVLGIGGDLRWLNLGSGLFALIVGLSTARSVDSY